jgi:hypothetical protein
MSSLVDDDTRRITGGDGRQLSEDVAGFGNHEKPEEMQPRHYDIVPRNQDGDVIFGCNDKVSFLVSSAVLRLTSKVFRALLDGKFKEGQELRTAANPQKIPAEVGDSHALHRLFCLLHHQCDPDTTLFPTNLADNQIAQSITASASRLQDLAVVIDYYGCSQPLDRVIDSLFNDFATPSIRDKMTFDATVHVMSAAYILDSSRYFRLFTKRLVTDYSEPFEDAYFEQRLPDFDIIDALREQSRVAWSRLKTAVGHFSKCQCTTAPVICLTGGNDRLLVEKLKDCLLPPGIAWPTERGEGITVRRLLVGFCNLERMQRTAWCDEHETKIFDTVGPADFRWQCRAIDNTDLVGLCLT